MARLFTGILTFYICCVGIGMVFAGTLDQKAVDQFIDQMVVSHHYDAENLKAIFSQAKLSSSVLNAISRPAEALPWYKYRPIFLQSDRINQGVIFFEKYREILSKAEKKYGVPAKIIVAIIGVETKYGKITGKDRVIDALSTLAFHYPKRSKFFTSELEHYLLLTREQDIDPLSLKGSYAGAMGIPQFISSSYREYAIDFDEDGKIDIWQNPIDAIGSVANYFNKHGWIPGEDIAIKGSFIDHKYIEVKNTDLKPDIPVKEINKYGIKPQREISDKVKVKILSFDNNDFNEIWLGLNNFYVITRYNNSPLYAMAVFQLADEINREYENKLAKIK